MIDIRYTNRNQFIKYICLLNNNKPLIINLINNNIFNNFGNISIK